MQDKNHPYGKPEISDQLLKEADKCVKCGLCLPHCPTYLKLTDEADSPRGRISLIQALVKKDLNPGKNLRLHLDRCLGCRACEKSCPSGVEFGKLLDGARKWVRKTIIKHSVQPRPWLLEQLSDRTRLKKIIRLLPLIRCRPFLAAGKKFFPAYHKKLLKIVEILPDRIVEPGLFPAHRPSGKSLQIFIGCAASIADQPAIDAATQLLTKLGYAVEIPRNLVCCGALHRHNGYPERADQFCATNQKWLKNSRAEALLTLATACHLELIEQQVSRNPVLTITDFLLDIFRSTSTPEFAPSSARVAVHTPCSSLKDKTLQLLTVIPNLEVFELPQNALCCGAAGSYLVNQPELAETFGEEKLALLRATKPNILVTTNTGCALQFRIQIEAANLHVEVLHPVELINRQLKHKAFRT